MRTHARSFRDVTMSKGGFTLIEIVLVILVILILLGLTMAVVGETLDGDRVRGAGSTVQNYLAGARDRAIYAASRQEDNAGLPPAIGVRFLPDPETIVPDLATPDPDDVKLVGFGSMVFVQEVEPMPTRLRVYLNQGVTPQRWEVSQLSQAGAGNPPPRPLDPIGMPASGTPANPPIRSMRALIDRGLVSSRMEPSNPISGANARTRVYYLPIYFDPDAAQEPYFVRFVDAPVASGGSLGGPDNSGDKDSTGDWLEVGLLSQPYFNQTALTWAQVECKFRLLPSAMPSEEPRIMPNGTAIDVESSVVAGVQVQDLLRADGSFDVLFNHKGVVEGPLSSAGLIHLVVVDTEDLERGFRIGSPFVDVDGTPGPDDTDGDGFDERSGDELIVSLRTQTGSIYVSDVNPVQSSSAPALRADPFLYAEAGGEAR